MHVDLPSSAGSYRDVDSVPTTPASRNDGILRPTPDTWGRDMIKRALEGVEEPKDREVHFLAGLITSCCPNACEDPDDSDDEEGAEYCQSCGAWGPMFISLKPYWHGFLRCLIDTWKCISKLIWRESEEDKGKNAIEMSVVKTPRHKDFKQEQN